jgi:hypothetical protein
MEENMQQAVDVYLARKFNTAKPDAVFVRNHGAWGETWVWTPTVAETRACCMKVPFSRRYKHCFSPEHIANLFNVTEQDLKKAIKNLKFRKTL